MWSATNKSRWRNSGAVAFGAIATLAYLALHVKVAGHDLAGVSRSVSVLQLPSVECATEALKATQCVTAVKQYSVGADVSWSFTEGRRDHPAYHVVVYECGDSGGHIAFFPRNGSQLPRISINSTLYAPGHPEKEYPQSRLARIRKTMDLIYAELSARCGPLPEPSAVVETTYQHGSDSSDGG